MCTPDLGIGEALAIGSALASAGGGILQANEAASNQAAAIRAKNQGTADMLAKQAELQKQSTGLFDQTLQPFQGSTAPNLQTAQAANTDTISANAPTASQLASGAITSNAPRVVQTDADNSIASRLAKLKASDAALGNLTGYDSANQTNSRNVKAAADKIGTLGGFANENAAVGNALTGAAVANSQQAPSPWGDILSGAGQVGSYYAGKKGAFGNLFGGGAPKTGPLIIGNAEYY